ncbi:hypothetical protein J7K25_07710 [bacterium]|nr:hypothetical protein [bacterium]
MLVIPAIDIEKNKVARLYKGNYEKVTFYEVRPALLTKKFIEAGAKRIHIVILSGAKDGKLLLESEEIIKRIIKVRDRLNPECKIQLGGGIRRKNQIDFYLSQGINFIIMGTSLLIPLLLEQGYTKRDIKFFYQQGGKTFILEKEVPEIEIMEQIDDDIKRKIIVALDFRKNEVGISGWNVTVPLLPEFLLKKFVEKGFCRFLMTNIEKDGTLEGIDIEPFERILKKAEVIRSKIKEILISGGVKDENDLEILNSLEYKVDGVVIGKAIYDGTIDIKKAISIYQKL